MTESGRISGYNADLQFRSASVTKAMLLVAVLRRAGTRKLSAHEKALLKPMITESDNDAAETAAPSGAQPSAAPLMPENRL